MTRVLPLPLLDAVNKLGHKSLPAQAFEVTSSYTLDLGTILGAGEVDASWAVIETKLVD
jgi:hypothetical protein